MPKRVTSYIPNMITLCNLLSGCIAIYMAFRSSETIGCLTGMQWSWIFIGAASMFDFFDGASARLFRAYSNIGRELDSLADLVSFGVAPGMLILNLMEQYTVITWLPFVALLIPVFGAYRLAKFNVDTTQSTTFRGLPIPANAIFWIGFSASAIKYGYTGLIFNIALILLIGWLMISNIRMFSLKFKNFDLRENFRRYILLAATVFFVICWGIAGLQWSIVLYFFISILARKED